jgi:chaperonin cofactor prefoldin
VEPAPDTRRQLGQIMVDEGFLTETQLLDALAEQNRTGTPLGKVLVDLGFVSPGAVANALAEQHGGLLRTEYGTSAGLREMASRAPIRTDAQPALPVPASPPPPAPVAATPPSAPPLGAGLRLAGAEPQAAPQQQVVQPPAPPAPEPQPVAPEPVAAAPEPVAPEPVAPEPVAPEPVAPQPVAPEPVAVAPEPAPQPDPAHAERIQELESKLHAVLTERNSLAQNLNELQARLNEAAQAHEAGVAAEVQERVGSLEAQLQAATAQREELERAQEHASGRVAELERQLSETDGGRQALEAELEGLRAVAAGRDEALGRIAALEAELEELRSRAAEDHSGDLHELTQAREAAEERARALEHDLGQLREQAGALQAELDAAREQASNVDHTLAEKVSGLEASLEALTAERDSALARAAELEQSSTPDDGLTAHISSLEERVQALTTERDDALARLRDAATPFAGSNAEVADLRKQLAARERRLAESVGEIAKMNREHRALLQLVERQFQLEETTTSVPEPRNEAAHVLFVPAASGYTLVEREGIAPEAGDVVEVEGERFVVRRHGPSPLPGPRRRCAYLERA